MKTNTKFEKETHVKPPKRKISQTKLIYNTLKTPQTSIFYTCRIMVDRTIKAIDMFQLLSIFSQNSDGLFQKKITLSMQQKTHLEVLLNWNFKKNYQFWEELMIEKKLQTELLLVFWKKFKFFNCYTSKGQFLAENFNRTLRSLLKKRVFGQNTGDMIDEINVATKRCNDEKFF